jgi:hypothetical protein
MDNLGNNNEKAAEVNCVNLLTALSIFSTRTPLIIGSITKAVKEENLTEIEELAAKLISYSNQAQLTGFTAKAKDLVIAVRERNKSAIDKNIESLKRCFEQMTGDINPLTLDQKLEFDNSPASLNC